MKRTLIAIAAVSLITALTGCASHNYCRSTNCPTGSCAPEPACASCDGQSCDYAADPGACEEDPGPWYRLGRRKERIPRGAVEAYNPGPATGAVTYPYYTNRGPRDFLARELPSIGP